jgi:hypothetical protein
LPIPSKPQIALVECRRSPSYEVDLPCQVATEGGDLAWGRIKDISLTGLQLQGDGAFMRKIYPTFKRADWRTPLQIDVQIDLPTSQQQLLPINVRCQQVYCNRLGEDVFRVGCQYLDIPRQVQAALLDHLQHFGVPKYD